MQAQTNNQNGFTLVELLIALVIFAVGILGVATMQTTSIKGNSHARRISEATNVAADRIEQIMSLDYEHADLTDDTDNNGGNFGLDDATQATADGYFKSANGNYELYWNIAEDHIMTGTKTINFIVDPSGNGKNISIMYSLKK